MHALPILTKASVQENSKEFYSETASRMRCTVVHTSGTTGAGLVFPTTIAAEREQWAVWWRYRARFGVDRNTWYAHFYGKIVVPKTQSKPPFWRVNLPGRQILFSGYHMCPRNLGFYVDELNRRRPPWIQGYPSLLAMLASFMDETGIRLTYRPDIVTTGAETLLPHQKHIIEAAFGTSCRQHYGMTEGVANISECPEGCLHVDEDYALVEFIPIGAGSYRIIGTNFSNYAFPLLRYDTGDIAQLSPASVRCKCGRAGRVVHSIDGRIEDYIVLPDGTKIGRLDHVFKDMINIKEAQVLQEDPASVVFRIVRNSRYTERDEERLLRDVRQRLGSEIKIELAYVDSVERTRTQKLRFVISTLPEGRLHPCKQS
jgi:phenylacetate-CoA ligase